MKRLVAVLLAAMLIFSLESVCYAQSGEEPKIEFLGEDIEDDIEDINDFEISLSKTSYTYTSKEIKPKVNVINKSEALVLNRDYTVEYINNVNAGTARAVIKGINSYKGTAERKFKINPKSIVPKITLSNTCYSYNGNAKKPAVSVYWGETKLSSPNYSISYPSGRKNVGTYNIKVVLKGNFSGEKTASFKIKPSPSKITKLEAGTKKLTAYYSKKTAQVTGYQLQYATDSAFSKNAVKTSISDVNKTKKVISSLKSKTRYFVRIRTYKTVEGVKYYSDWSAYSSVKIK